LHQDNIGDFLSAAKNLQVKEIALGFDMDETFRKLPESQSENIGHTTIETIDTTIDTTENSSVTKETLNELTFNEVKTSPIKQECENVGQVAKAIIDDNAVSGKKYSCSKCSYSSNNSGNIKKHYNAKHADVDSRITYKCPVCSRAFFDSSGMNRHHKSVHLDVKYQCDECDSQFASKKSLSRHTLTVHKGIVLRHYCDEGNCDSSFSNVSDLKSHKDHVHHGILFQMFQCPDCVFTANTKHTLNVHIRFKHKNISYKCELCDFQERELRSYRRHMNAVHWHQR